MRLRNVLLLCTIVQLSLQNLLSLAQGKVRGIPQDGYISYIGIPYASVIGSAGRFKRADIAPVWNTIRESRDPHCASTSAAEDCLQLDVHVPNTGSEMPTFVWVKGSSGYYHPGKLVTEGIIVVVVRHRLGPLGFLCTREDKIPGNAGIKDVLLALRWVRDNIVAFKGNPHRIVLGGQGFGAAMVEALMFVPSSNGLYHGVILQSGSVLCPWTFNYDAEARAVALRKMLNNSEDVAPTIMKTDTVTLATNAAKIRFPYIPFGICVEKPFKHEEGIILETPFHLLLKQKLSSVPVLMGYNTNEAYVFSLKLNETRVTRRMARDIKFLIPEELQTISRGELIQVTKQIRNMYFHDNMNMAAILSYHSVRFHAMTHQPVYFYQFSYSGNTGVIPEPGLKKNGAAHSDELGYLFPTNGEELQDDDGVVQQNLIRLWTNFIKQLNPTPEGSDFVKWEPTSPHHSNNLRLLDINTELEMKEFPYTQASKMWQNLYEKHYYTRNPETPV